MRIAVANNTRLHWREDGNRDGPVLVMANSLGTDLRLWDDVVALLPSNLRIIRFDKRGHGLSECPDSPYSLMDLTTDTEALLDHLGVTECAFVGLSVGGMIGQSLAKRRPDLVRALVLSNSAVKMGEPAMWNARMDAILRDGIDGMADSIMERWFAPAFLETEALTAWRNMLTRTPQDGYIGCCHAIAGADLSHDTATLRLPVMGIAGSHDGASPAEIVAQTIELIPGATCHIIEGTGHLPCVEAPAECAALLVRFLKEIGHV